MNQKIKILITSGGTSEPIDNVRKITNNSSGRLGSMIADQLCNMFTDVTYMCSRHNILPTKKEHMTIINNVTGAEDLLEKIKKLKNDGNEFDFIIHAMAVSDYKVEGIYITSDLIKNDNLENVTPLDRAGKVSSDMDDLCARLVPNPKVINHIKEIFPNCKLVGFKLLDDATEDELKKASMKVIKKSNADFVLANDLKNIDAYNHKAILFDKDGEVVAKFNNKTDITKGIESIITKF